MKYKVLRDDVFDGYKRNDIIEREPHAMEYHLERGHCEVVGTSQPSYGMEFDGTVGDFECDVCGKVSKTKAGLAAHKRSHK